MNDLSEFLSSHHGNRCVSAPSIIDDGITLLGHKHYVKHTSFGQGDNDNMSATATTTASESRQQGSLTLPPVVGRSGNRIPLTYQKDCDWWWYQ